MSAIRALCIIFVLAVSNFVIAGPLPDTGQVKCYDNSVEIACPQSGEAFYGQDGSYLIYPPVYTKLDADGNDLPDSASSWSMARDNITGLIWEVKTDDGSINDKDNTYSWNEAQTVFIPAIQGFGGYGDWRLPTLKELATLVDYSGSHPSMIDIDYFPNTLSTYYWTSTAYAESSDYAWHVGFSLSSFLYASQKTTPYSVRAVRGAQTTDHPVDNGDHTVTDSKTDLMWQQATAGPMNWESALAYCEALSLGAQQHTDWRLPNIRELRSLPDYTRYSPPLDTGLFPDSETSISSHYWSSTTGQAESFAWSVNAYDGGPKSGSTKIGAGYVRAVRSVSTVASYYYVSTNGECGEKSPCFGALQEAVNAAVSGGQIRVAQGIYSESFVLNEAKSLTLEGGWNASFGSQTANTTFIGAPTVQQGALRFLMVTIRSEKALDDFR